MKAISHIPIDSPGYRRLFRTARRNPVEGMGYNSPWIYYNRQTAAAAAVSGTLFFFSQGLGASVNLAQTNLEQANQLPPPERALVIAIRFLLRDNMNQTDISAFLYTTVIRMYVGKSIYAEGLMNMFPGGAGVGGFTTTTASNIFANGNTDPRAVNSWGREGGVPIGIDQTFRVEVIIPTSFTTTGNGYDVTAAFNSWRVREVS
jgi:hypothetical protein